ncbi:acyltransferase family protein [Amorphoplanes nipponensis]|uniref:Acyltransferase 3 domain-containing protein n=1 Tax=Actinoplanes nipponensis TaxID=135950 RepID=A0A919JGT5_9ACTN|nr:acyltransferase family protein [Actinoplanes nipponensis]GIE49232.1 hypothetical protein Ani05nite_27660 [Actinoplanes nipponensis]
MAVPATPTPGCPPPAVRLVSLDVIRVAVVAMVIVHHAAQPYGPGGEWPVRDAAHSDWFRPFYTVNAAVGLGLLFLIAGHFVPQSHDRKGPRRFLRERASRLGLPLLVFGLAANLPIALATERPRSPRDFAAALYADAWMPLYLHLWFVAHLLLYSAVYVVWRRYTGRTPRTWPAPGHRAILVFAVGLIAVTWAIRLRYAVDEWVPLGVIPAEPARLPQYVTLFVLGAMAGRGGWLRALPRRVGLVWLAVGLAAAAGMVAVQTMAPPGWHFNELANGGPGWQSLVRCTLEGFICAGLAVGLPVAVRELARRPLRVVSAAAAASYAAYVLHLYILVPLQAAMTGPDASPFVKFGIVAVPAVLLSFGAAHLSRRVPGLRRLLGTAPPPPPASLRPDPGTGRRR